VLETPLTIGSAIDPVTQMCLGPDWQTIIRPSHLEIWVRRRGDVARCCMANETRRQNCMSLASRSTRRSQVEIRDAARDGIK